MMIIPPIVIIIITFYYGTMGYIILWLYSIISSIRFHGSGGSDYGILLGDSMEYYIMIGYSIIFYSMYILLYSIMILFYSIVIIILL